MGEKWIDALLVVAAVIFELVRFGFRKIPLSAHLWEAFTPWVWAFSLVAVGHSIRAALRLIRDIKLETSIPGVEEGSIFLPSGTRVSHVKSAQPARFFRAQVWSTAMVVALTALFCAVGVFMKALSERASDASLRQPLIAQQMGPLPLVPEPLKDAYIGELGNPVEKAHPVAFRDIYQAAHQHAIALWLHETMSIYLLLSSGQWEVRPDPDWGSGTQYTDDSWLRIHFHGPSDRTLFPPYAGVAVRWVNGDNQKLGWRKWHGYFGGPDLPIVQRFDHGLMLGGLAVAPSNSDGQVFILLNNHTWFQRAMKSKYRVSLFSPTPQ